ncbi:hypothetical protein E9M_07604 [Moraxella catarrhalis 46P47B1]|uniref:Membrane protein n=1 Tax=Moraxella catarrhalis TaxID=480 RepID=A0A3S9QG99_MORCA|nr:putative membrane protein [Moraxella catarrhalis]EGE10201.1 hypothetical protein E9G_08230 [Moraxella catarrhalis 7169]EGE10752.1 hypothetical protein E9M_07604 [Moraxella catarrhalis 46P47B1]EGE16155.1 hypothetical protein E9O_02668 [Moraxella catarrhalis 12P80B1]EGE18156.1 hypothetical protein E9S_08904 [Moraxella catarrhalis BC7]EGE18560.1 hypothetical protein E9Q_03578 [Moraxella catarrhalis BC1]EGE22383.1 hypothetical protein E9U_00050 [Moraxella catarrhalis BC8]EGE22554.1 hypothetic
MYVIGFVWFFSDYKFGFLLLIYYAGFLPIKQDFIILSCLVC